MTTPTAQLPDASDRERAATTFDRNVVVTAGAGTGKTRLLVDRLLHLLMRDPEVKLTQTIALTFTNKAANEMKIRLRERLGSYLAARLDREPTSPRDEETQRELRSLMERYHLSKERLDRRALEALRQIERSEIGTIHSFAATLLRLYPMESGVDPQFLEDDGTRFERLFNELWGLWLDQELSYQGARRDDWKRVLRKIGLDEIRALASSLCSEVVDLQRLTAIAHEERTPEPILNWLKSLEQRASLLLQRHLENRSNEKLVRASHAILQRFLRAEDGELEIDRDSLSGSINRNLKGWPDEDVEEAQEIVRVATALCQVDDSLTCCLCDILIPFVEDFREAFTREGTISFDGLLARARTLVRDYPLVREELKRRFKAILIDEFQDTDPIQYEILIYVAEEIGQQAKDWRRVKLTPGKIFVVGDPKQSIYAFRRADIEAYLEVVEKIIKVQNGTECHLTTNFRSHGNILDTVNGVFSRLIQSREGLQPAYVAIQPAPLSGNRNSNQSPLPFRKVTIRKVQGESERLNINLARRLEAESLARWLEEEVLGKAQILDEEGRTRLVQPKDVAILLRKLTEVHHYLEPLRRRGLPYVVEGERHFYAAQEVIDAVNLLRTVENPHDRLALVGVLRSPLGALTDAEIYELHRQRLLDYRTGELFKESKKKPFADVKELYEALCRLHRETRFLPVGEAIAHVFGSLPIRLLAASSFHGEQAVANLEKLRQQAELIGREGLGTLKEVIGRLGSRVLEIREEAESALAEENLDAIRILSIHKSKGLEFPVVVLAECHTVPNQTSERDPAALHDWSTNLVGLRTTSYWSLPGLYIAERARRREEEEQKRVLYVAMTRAREHLMISCAPTERRYPGSYLSMLEESLSEDITSRQESHLITAGDEAIELRVVQESLSPPGRARKTKKEKPSHIDWKYYAQIWRRRAEECESALRTPLFLTPTLLKQREQALTDGLRQKENVVISSELSLVIGELAHRFLEDWNFGDDPAKFRARLGPFLDKWIEPKQQGNRAQLQRELEEIFGSFFSSEVYCELSSSDILGREVPLLIPWDRQVMEGVIDVLYEKNGLLYLADYKSDRVQREELSHVAENYSQQVRIYTQAAQRSLQRQVAGFKLVFLRLGEAIELL
jgi:ATP-dependent helicase/nuclease subunit A